MSPAAPEATNRASTAPRSDGVARLVGRGGEVATATGRTPRRSMQTRRRLPDGGRPGKRRQEPFGPGRRPNQQEPRREGGHAGSRGSGRGGPGRDGDRDRLRG